MLHSPLCPTQLRFSIYQHIILCSSSLQYVQVLGKSAKPIPVLILGVLIGGRSYPRIKYLIVLLIVIGVALFFYKEESGIGSVPDQHKFLDLIGFGEMLIVRIYYH